MIPCMDGIRPSASRHTSNSPIKLAAKGILVPFISTLKNIHRLPPTVCTNLKFVEIQLPSVPTKWFLANSLVSQSPYQAIYQHILLHTMYMYKETYHFPTSLYLWLKLTSLNLFRQVFHICAFRRLWSYYVARFPSLNFILTNRKSIGFTAPSLVSLHI